MTLSRYLGSAPRPAGAPPASPGETETVRRIVRELDALPPERARFLAAFAYTLARAASADLHISDVETTVIERLVEEHGGLPAAHAVLVAQIAKSQAELTGGTDDFIVTRAFRELSDAGERLALLRCCYLVGAADESISAEEVSVLGQIARELDIDRADLNAIRAEFADRLALIQAWFGGRSG